MLRKFLKKWRKKEEAKPTPRIEREIWYELVFNARAWSHSWHQYLESDNPEKPMTKDEFIDKMIKKYKLTDREQKHP